LDSVPGNQDRAVLDGRRGDGQDNARANDHLSL
jgi:hypothetical protein